MVKRIVVIAVLPSSLQLVGYSFVTIGICADARRGIG
jgi:hypothetical protein